MKLPPCLSSLALLASIVATAGSAESGRWPHGATAAVSLSYDDSVPVHHLHVAPLLERHGLRATNSATTPCSTRAAGTRAMRRGCPRTMI